MENKNPKIEALGKHLGLDKELFHDEIEESSYNDCLFEVGRQEYLVYTDEEADAATRDQIEELVWAFNPSFLRCHLKDGIDEEVIELLQEKCEGANEAIKSLIKDFDYFVEDAIAADGRGHTLSSYDGEENEEKIDDEYYFIYRVN